MIPSGLFAIYCRDGKWRPTQPGLFPLAHGATARMGRTRAYGLELQNFLSAFDGYFEMRGGFPKSPEKVHDAKLAMFGAAIQARGFLAKEPKA